LTPYWRTAHEVDRRQSAGKIPYCIIKSYCGRADFDDGNIDVVVNVPLKKVYSDLYADAFSITLKDKVKSLLYERNKLMLSPRDTQLAKIHLHSNAGWHNICFVPADEIFAAAEVSTVDGHQVTHLSRSLEARIGLFHFVFEKFAKSPDDANFLVRSDYVEFVKELGLPSESADQLIKVSGDIPISFLSKFWRAYYRHKEDVSLWNVILHALLVALQVKRRRAKDTN
jgi:hypothetical protein